MERQETRMRWYGHARRKYDGYIGRMVLRMELSGKRKRGRRKRMFMDVVNVDLSGKTADRESAVATPDGKSRKKKN